MPNPTVHSQTYSNRVEYFNRVEYSNALHQTHRLDGPAIEYNDGRQVWFENGQCHREGGPAYVNPNGVYGVKESWWFRGKLHRLDGPARIHGNGLLDFAIHGLILSKDEFMKQENVVVDGDGTKNYYLGDKLHRENGPAIEYSNGTKEWFINGLLHRTDGPAQHLGNGAQLYWLNGKHYRKAEYFKQLECGINSAPHSEDCSEKVDEVVVMSKDKIKVDGEGFFSSVKKNAVVAAPRVLAKTISKGARQGLLQLMKAKKLKKHWIKSIEEMMETEYGLATISMGLSLVFKYMPGLKDDPRAALICDEFQVGAMEGVGNELVDEVMAVMLPAIMQYQSLDLGKSEKLRVAPTKEVMEEEEEPVVIPPLQASLKVA